MFSPHFWGKQTKLQLYFWVIYVQKRNDLVTEMFPKVLSVFIWVHFLVIWTNALKLAGWTSPCFQGKHARCFSCDVTRKWVTIFGIGLRGATDVYSVGGGSLGTKAFNHHLHPACCATHLLTGFFFTLNGRGGENMEDELLELLGSSFCMWLNKSGILSKASEHVSILQYE